ncbi:MAG TPA: nucleotidyltransferase family protein [Thermoanaerobaculia bacterium]|nr:nucleotidyltransferase family protein [Thermoanaerobaculia bacterium]
MDLPNNLWQVVARAAGLPSLPPGSDDEAARFIGQCHTEGVLPLLFAFPPADERIIGALAGWRALAAAHRRRTEVIRRTILALPSLIEEDFALLKGSDLAWRLYPQPELRPMGDIDILVRSDTLERVIARLGRKGFRRNRSRLQHYSPRNPDLAFDLGDVTLEVHHSIVYRSAAKIDYDDLWNRRKPLQLDGVTLQRLDDTDAAVVAAMNVAKDHLCAPLIKHLDLWLMVRADARLASAVLARAAEWKARNAVHAAFGLASLLFTELSPPPARPLFDRLVTHSALEHRDLRRLPAMVRWWRKFWLLDRLDFRMLYAADIILARIYGMVSQIPRPWGRFGRASLESARTRHPGQGAAPSPRADNPQGPAQPGPRLGGMRHPGQPSAR